MAPALSMPLPARAASSAAPVWSIDREIALPDSASSPHLSSENEKCAKEGSESERTVCCRELKGEDDRTLIDPDILRDLVIGFSDGISVPFALASGLSALGSTRLVVIGGLAELLSGAISMGIGGFLAAQGDRNQYLYLNRTTQERVARSCVGEMEREVFEVLEKTGVDSKVSSLVTASLYRAEKERRVHIPAPRFSLKSLRERVGDDVGLTPFLVHFGEGMQETTRLRMIVSGLTVGLGYLIGGIIPLIPYLIIHDNVLRALYWSIGVTVFVLVIFGGAKSYYTGQGNGVRGLAYGIISTVSISATAAVASYFLVKALEG